jgi:hypothetical protein
MFATQKGRCRERTTPGGGVGNFHYRGSLWLRQCAWCRRPEIHQTLLDMYMHIYIRRDHILHILCTDYIMPDLVKSLHSGPSCTTIYTLYSVDNREVETCFKCSDLGSKLQLRHLNTAPKLGWPPKLILLYMSCTHTLLNLFLFLSIHIHV